MSLPTTIPLATLLNNPNMQDTRRIKLAVVGAGGIGARVLPTLVKMLPDGDRAEVFVIDPDIVEPKNLRRQPFGPDDVGNHKAVVMQDRYSTPGLPVTAITEPFKPEHLRNDGDAAMVVLGCVDNTAARYAMLSAVVRLRHYPSLYIDAGNDGNRGQVLIAYANLLSQGRTASGHRYHTMSAVDKYPDVWAPTDPKPEGCDLLDTQTPMANLMAATFILQYLTIALHGQVLGSLGVTFSTLGATDRIPMLLHGSQSAGFGQYNAVFQRTPPDQYGHEMHDWMLSWVSDEAAKRRAEAVTAAGKKAKPETKFPAQNLAGTESLQTPIVRRAGESLPAFRRRLAVEEMRQQFAFQAPDLNPDDIDDND